MSKGTRHFSVGGCALAIGVTLVLAFALVAWTGGELLSVPMCKNDLRQEVLSPDGRQKMIVFCRDCGATTGFNSQGSILGVGEELPDEEGSVFITDKDEATVVWPEAGKVVVTLKGSGSDFKLEKQFHGVTIEYK